MNKELLEAVKLFISQPLNNPLSRGQIMEVARIALPILEQQERGNKATLTDEKREWLIDECKADMQRYTSNSPRYLVAQIALASLEACCNIPEQPTNQNGEQ